MAYDCRRAILVQVQEHVHPNRLYISGEDRRKYFTNNNRLYLVCGFGTTETPGGRGFEIRQRRVS